MEDDESIVRLMREAPLRLGFDVVSGRKRRLIGHMIYRSEGRHLHAVVDPAQNKPDIASIWARTMDLAESIAEPVASQGVA